MSFIFVTGLPRTGTTWVSQTIAVSTKSKLVHEPFNWKKYPERSYYHMKYLPKESGDLEFIKIVNNSIKARSGLLKFLDTKILIKDVHCCICVEYLWEVFKPLIIFVIRHPCAMANSWNNLNYEVTSRLEILLAQDILVEKYLEGFIKHLRKSDDYFFQIGAYWGASYYIMDQISSAYMDWQWVTHESLCYELLDGYKKLLNHFNIKIRKKSKKFIQEHNQARNSSNNPYSTFRDSTGEPKKWEKTLKKEQISAVLDGATPFGIFEKYYNE